MTARMAHSACGVPLTSPHNDWVSTALAKPLMHKQSVMIPHGFPPTLLPWPELPTMECTKKYTRMERCGSVKTLHTKSSALYLL